MQSSKRPDLFHCLFTRSIGRDIDALIAYIGSGLSGELDPSRIAVMGGSCEYLFSSLRMTRTLNIAALRWRIHGLCELD
jgi:hypothetical protein